MKSLSGTTLGHYEVGEVVGAGGMGEVYRARDTRLGRDIALKILPEHFAGDPTRLARFRREARAVAALSHPHIVVVHSVEEDRGHHFITMELVEGKALDKLLVPGGLPIDRVLRIATGIAEALAAAHAKGVVHRDLKPGNVMVGADDRIKVLDFGLAGLVHGDPEELDATGQGATMTALTAEGTVMGTAPYMSPEQAAGRATDARSDVFSFGAVLYELLAGRRAFEGPSRTEVLAAVLKASPEPLPRVRSDAPPDLVAIVDGCLAKDLDDRPADGAAVFAQLSAIRERLAERTVAGPGRSYRLPLIALVLLVVVAGGWLFQQRSRTVWVHEEAIPNAMKLAGEHDYTAAFELARQAERIAPDDPRVASLLDLVSIPASATSEPPGAAVAYRAYRRPDDPWTPIGTTPFDGVRLPDGYLVYRLELPGRAPVLRTDAAALGLHFELPPADPPEGMVWIPAGRSVFGLGDPVDLPAFHIDRFEVTNEQFQAFVDAGGYQREEFWPGPFTDGSRELTREEALGRFKDSTGRPGPAVWELGRFPAGSAKQPVTGISAYEAEAYARFAGTVLPTIYHWYRAAQQSVFSDILVMSRFGTDAPVPVGEYAGIGPFGNYDMAGNAREWVANSVGNRRWILGGGFSDAPYFYRDGMGADPFDRSPLHGFRTMQPIEPAPEATLAPVNDLTVDFRSAQPADDPTFETYRSLHAYDRDALNARVESTDDSHPEWIRQVVSFDAAYGNERVPVHIFLPRGLEPPYQPILFFPHSGARALTSSRDLLVSMPVDYIPRTGRALVFPIFQGTFERGGGSAAPSGYQRRDQIVSWSRDVSRTVDYLETRDDIDVGKLGYLSISLGAEYGPIFTALDSRFSAAVLASAHLHAHQMRDPPEIQPLHFLPRSTVPTLMINGDNDFTAPVETSLQPMLELLGAPPEHKRLVLLDGGHVPAQNDVTAHVLDWFDRYLGPVTGTR